MKIFCIRDYFPFQKDNHKIILIMRLSLILSFIAIIQTSGAVFSQKVSLNVKNKTMREVLKSLEGQSNYRFFYNDQLSGLDHMVSLKTENKTVVEVLDQLFTKQVLSYKVLENNMIVIAPTEITQQKKISGIVSDALTGEPLIGVNIVIEGTTIGIVSDSQGRYSIELPNENAVLVFSYIGYLQEKMTPNGRTIIDIKLAQDIQKLDEVVVIGYGKQKRITVVGAITTINTRELKQSPTTNLSNALAGRLPGMTVNQFSGGEPGVDQSDIYVRGVSTYNTGNNSQKPIVIVDGVERSYEYLNPDEVETFTILKDASSTAVYGVRGANGVILVTTRRGRIQDKPTVTFKAASGLSSAIKFPEYLGSADYATLYNEARLNDDPNTSAKLFTAQQIENYRNAKGDNSDGLGYNINLFDYAFKPSLQQDYSLNISGGTKTTRYFVLAGYMKQDGNYNHTDLGPYNTNAVFKRYNFRSNVDIDITKNFYVKLDLGGRIQQRTAPGTTAGRVVTIANTQPSIYPIILENNNNPANANYVAKHPEGLLFGSQVYRYNMLGELAYSGFKDEYKTFMDGTFTMGHKLDFITPGLNFEVQFSYDSQQGNTIDRTIPHESEGYREYGGYATFYPSEGVDVLMNGGNYTGAYSSPRRTENSTMQNGFDARTPQPQRKNYGQASLTYARSFGQHNIGGLLMGNRSKRSYQNDVAYANEGLAFRGTYNFDEKYLFELDAAYNGSENFAKGKRYGFFPAVSAGWVLSKEKFLQTNSFINYLKVRGSYGLVGSDQLPGDRFGYLQFFESNGDNYNLGMDLNSAIPANLYEGNLANTLLTWEKARKTNIGLETKILNNKLSLTIDGFYEYRYDILTQPGDNGSKNISAIVGKSSPQLNLGTVENKGIDFEIGWNDKIGKHFAYYIKPNFTFARNKILNLNEIDRIAPDGNPVPYANRTGKRIGEQFVYQFDHYVKNQTEADQLNASNYQKWGRIIPGDVVYKDINGDGQITDQEDRIAMGNPRIPEIQFGIPAGISYNGIDFSVLFQGATNNSVLLTDAAAWDFPMYGQDIIGRVKKIHLNRWTPATAETATYPALHYGKYDNNKNNNSSLFLKDASYIRLKTIELGYTIPERTMKKIGLSSARLYVQGLNLFTWDKLKDYDVDPETSQGGDWYPIQRVYNIGIDVTF